MLDIRQTTIEDLPTIQQLGYELLEYERQH